MTRPPRNPLGVKGFRLEVDTGASGRAVIEAPAAEVSIRDFVLDIATPVGEARAIIGGMVSASHTGERTLVLRVTWVDHKTRAEHEAMLARAQLPGVRES
jgi:hypothetical protein